MFKFLKNLFGPAQITPTPEPHPLDGATRAAQEKVIVPETPQPVAVQEVAVQPEPAPVVEKKPRKPRAKKAEPTASAEWPFSGPAAMTPAPKTRKPRNKKAQ